MSSKPITFTNSEDFRIRLVLATLSGKPVRISGIRSDDVDPGLRDYEVSFLRLLEAITNGSAIEISYTGTTVIYRPGVIIGGTVRHKCPLSRGVGYFIEPVLLLAPFGKKPLTLTLEGVTSSSKDTGVDTIRTAVFPVMEKFGIDRQELRIVKRGAEPQGGGEVVLSLPRLILQPNTLHATETPQVTKIRGIAYSTRVSPASVNRIIEAARAVLKPTASETFIYSDVARGEESGKSPGFGITIVAETKPGWAISAEGVGAAGVVPEDLGRQVACQLLQNIASGGVVGRNQLELALVFMVLGKEDIGRMVISKDCVDKKFVRLLRYFKALFNLEIASKDHSETELMLTVKGSGFVSSSKRIA
ncbi:RNA 3'-terminal phosphate cyclase-like protein [Trichomonascus vanleenenianus]|uniref:rRNA-processing endoribonuclease n=1 Tax=Trichomonascus vanleenenianus TaxID=2268995 RepID=UPI003ECA74EB